MSPPPQDATRSGRRSDVAARLARTFAGQLTDGLYAPGTRFPSIRALASLHGCAGNTVASALEQLVAQGWLEPRPGAGFFVRHRGRAAAPAAPESSGDAIDPAWLLRQQYGEGGGVAAGLPPPQWLRAPEVERVMRKLARMGEIPQGYGDPAGFEPLRHRLCERLAGLQLSCEPRQIVTFGGANVAIDMALRALVQPGDHLLVDDPGYYPLFGKLRLAGAVPVAVPRLADGPDPDVLDKLAARWGPCLFITQPHAHNPTGGHLADSKARAIVEVARRHGLRLIELDPLAHVAPRGASRLCALDGFENSLYVGTFSKLLPSGLRAGFIAAEPALASRITAVKNMVGINTSEFTERLVADTMAGRALSDHADRLRLRIGEAARHGIDLLQRLGAEVMCPEADSLYAWARFDAWPDAGRLARIARDQGLTLAPGQVFSVEGQVSPWLRFNVAAMAESPHFATALTTALHTSRDSRA